MRYAIKTISYLEFASRETATEHRYRQPQAQFPEGLAWRIWINAAKEKLPVLKEVG